MKRFTSLLLALVMLLILVGCGNTEKIDSASKDESQTDEPSIAESDVPEFTATALDFATVMDEVCQGRYEEICTPIEEGDFADYLVDDPSTVNLLSDAEIDLLVNFDQMPVSDRVTKEEALSDVSMLFRALHSGYGAYYYFGAENFAAAETSLCRWVNGQGGEIDTDELNRKIVESLSFVEDAHFNIYDNGSINNWDDSDIRWEYFYCDGFEFEKDDSGFYQTDESGIRWDVSEISDDRVRIERTLMKDGRIVYAPVLFCTRPTMENSTIALVSSTGEHKEYDLVWTESEPGKFDDIYRLIQEDNISYISVKDYDRSLHEPLNQYVADAVLARESEIIIYDLRSNRGGASDWSCDWVANFLGIPSNSIQFEALFSARSSKLFDKLGYENLVEHGMYRYSETNGIWQENNVPIIILMDDRCGSSGESALRYLKTMDNVIVVGSNSAGYQLCGNVAPIRLPYLGLVIQFGCNFQLSEQLQSVDYRGYEPDIWCNPADALDAVMNMLIYYGVAEEASLLAIKDELSSHHEIALRMPWGDIARPEEGFGTGDKEITFTVLADGEEFADFTIESGDQSVCTVEKNDDATFTLHSLAHGDSWLTITCGKSSARFRWHSE